MECLPNGKVLEFDGCLFINQNNKISKLATLSDTTASLHIKQGTYTYSTQSLTEYTNYTYKATVSPLFSTSVANCVMYSHSIINIQGKIILQPTGSSSSYTFYVKDDYSSNSVIFSFDIPSHINSTYPIDVNENRELPALQTDSINTRTIGRTSDTLYVTCNSNVLWWIKTFNITFTVKYVFFYLA